MTDSEREALQRAMDYPWCRYPSHVTIWKEGITPKRGRRVTAPKRATARSRRATTTTVITEDKDGA